MKIIQPSFEFITPLKGDIILSRIEECGRVCYKSEDRIAPGSAETFCKGIIKNDHEAVLEHCSLTVKMTVDRGVTHEIVRHRLASYCQESTRYCNYSKGKFGGEISVIEPLYLEKDSPAYAAWQCACETAEAAYFSMLDFGCTPQEARAVLPNSLKTEIVMTANIREWRHFFRQRCSMAAHPQIRQIAMIVLEACVERIPVLFDDILEEVRK